MKINRTIEVAIRAISFLRKSVNPISAKDLANQIGSTSAFLEQILRKMRISRLVIVKRGPGGGYTFNSELDPMTAFDVAQAVGADFGPLLLSETMEPADRVNREIVDAFLRTRI